MPPRITVVGSSNIDLLSRVPRLPKLGETLVGESFQLGYGGKGANQAVTAARLGAQVTMVTMVGRDVFGEGTLKNYREQGIDSTFVRFDETRASGVAPIFVDDAGRNFIVIIPGANDALSPEVVREASAAITGANIVICQLEVPIAATLEAFKIAKQANVFTILNPAPAAPLPDALLELTDILAPNETETELLTGRPVHSEEEAEVAARQLLERGPKTVIVTLGERGALVADGQTVRHAPGVKVKAVDSTGAGDAFIGSLATFLGEGIELEGAVRQANAVAALSVTQGGTQTSFPRREQVDAFLRELNLLA